MKIIYKFLGKTYNFKKSKMLESIELIKKNFEIKDLLIPNQVHSNKVIVVNDPLEFNPNIECDSLVTNLKNCALGVLTADCGAILMYDQEVIAACHAGWKGWSSSIINNTIDAMLSLGAKRESIKVVLGPMIMQENYEVKSDFIELISKLKPNVEQLILENNNRYYFDLYQGIIEDLINLGISKEHINTENVQDTYSHDNFFSYRKMMQTNDSNRDDLRNCSFILNKFQ